MNLSLNSHYIKAISVVLPKNPLTLEDELEFINLNAKKYEFFKQNSKISKHFVCDENIFASDLASKALEKILLEKLVDKNELDLLICVSFTPDFLAPQLSSLIHKNLELSKNTLCLDITGFCTGFLQGLFQAFLALENPNFNNIVLLCVSAKSKKINPKDKIAFLSNSDSASAILISKNPSKEKAFYSQKTFSAYAKEETLPLNAYNTNFDDFLRVNTDLFFNFVNENFPEFFEQFFVYSKQNKKEFDDFFFHSPNHFFAQKLKQNLKLDKFCSRAYETYGDCTLNTLALELCLYKEMLSENGGGIEKYSSQALEQELSLML